MLEELLVHAWLEGSVQDVASFVVDRAARRNPSCALMLEVSRGEGEAGMPSSPEGRRQ